MNLIFRVDLQQTMKSARMMMKSARMTMMKGKRM
jgi:hypothetical protein